MRRPEFVLVSALVVLATWIAVQASQVQGFPTKSLSAARLGDALPARMHRTAEVSDVSGVGDAANQEHVTATGAVLSRPSHDATPAAPARDLDEIRRRISQNQPGTYIGEILAERDSNIARWPDRTSRPLRVWVQTPHSAPDWNPMFIERVRDAFTTWESAGAPVPFTFVMDSSDADVHVSWVDHFDEQISGKTMWARDENWWIVDANIAIALHHNHGEALDASAVRAIALHEVGHLLGLDHCADTANIMTARVRVRELSSADKATMRLIYAVPPGSLRQ
jgi:hypothetical protein